MSFTIYADNRGATYASPADFKTLAEAEAMARASRKGATENGFGKYSIVNNETGETVLEIDPLDFGEA